jgi:hypothetical protein
MEAKMKRLFFIIISVALISWFEGCSDLQSELSAPVETGVHGQGTLDTASQGFHANMLAKNNWQLKNCQECHSKNFDGGPSGINCTKCHSTIEAHKNADKLLDISSADFHGLYFAAKGSKVYNCRDCHGGNLTGGVISPSCVKCHSTIGFHALSNDKSTGTYQHGSFFKAAGLKMNSCGQCHGDDYKGGMASPACATCHQTLAGHKTGIMDYNSPDFHGKYFKAANIAMSACTQCHGSGFTGGKSSPACSQCHSTVGVHKDGLKDPTSANFHGKAIRANNWDMTGCKTCHGNNYAGGLSSPSCKTCHSQSAGPEACNTCHGSFTEAGKYAPPKDLSGNTSTTAKGVGAHSNHLSDTKTGAVTACTECHKVPQQAYESGHMNGATEIIFGATAKQNTISSPAYNYGDNRCSNTYCHGGFKFKKSDAPANHQYIYTEDQMTGNNYSPKWNKVDGGEAACGTCHGLPPKGHIQVDLKFCVNCHGSVINEAGQIINKTKHINGKIDMN